MPQTPLHAENDRIVTIYHDGQEQVIATDAKTVGEALERAAITTQQHDAVEPGKNTPLVAQSYNVNIYRARPVTVIDGEQRWRIMSPYQSAKKIAEAAGLKTYDEDVLTIDRIDNFLAESGVGLKLTIQRATPMTLVLYGKQVPLRTQAKTVGELLKEKNVHLATQDDVWPGVSTPVSEGLIVDVYRDGQQTISAEQEVPFTTKQIQDGDQPIGFRQVKEPGVKGRKVVTFQLELKNGQEVARKEIQSVVTVQPKEQVEVVGVKAAGFSGSFGDALARLRSCESGGNYANKRNPQYRGAYQFSYGTWANYGGYYDPADAPAAVQDQAAFNLYNRRGWQPWPSCSSKLGLQDIYR